MKSTRMETYFVIAVAVSFWFAGCTDVYNPFEDETNSLAVFDPRHGNPAALDTVPLFATCTVGVVALVPRLADSITFQAPGSRLSTRLNLKGISEFMLPLSFFDTGLQTVTLTTHRLSGQRATQQRAFYITSPLSQKPIDTTSGAIVHLSTPRLSDSVWYHWSYGSPIAGTIRSRIPEISTRLALTGEHPGYLWVSSDPGGSVNASPTVLFTIRLADNSGPFIEALADSVNADTIVVADSSYTLDMRISDPSGVAWATIDAAPFLFADPPHYRQTVHHLELNTANSPRHIVVRAADLAGQSSVRTFVMFFDPKAIGARSTRLLLDGIGDTALTGASTLSLSGTVIDRMRSAVTVTARTMPGKDSLSVPCILDNGSGKWSATLDLALGNNTVELAVHSTGGTLLATKRVVVRKNAAVVDTVAPLLVEARIDMRTVQSGSTYYTPSDNAILQLTFFDLGGIATISSGSTRFTPVGPCTWQTTLRELRHDKPLALTMQATDSSGNATAFGITLVRNTLPVPDPNTPLPSYLRAGVPLGFPVAAIDPEDRVNVQLIGAPSQLRIESAAAHNAWNVTWAPQQSDTGTYSMTLLYSDGYQTTASPWKLTVLPDSTAQLRCSAPSGLQAVYQALRDTARIVIGIQSTPLYLPLHVRIFWLDKQVHDTLLQGNAFTWRWTPRAADTAEGTLHWSISDGIGRICYSYHNLAVVTRNQYPCSLSVSSPVSLLSNKYYNLLETPGPDTFRVLIHDRDHPLTETYRVAIVQQGTLVERHTRFPEPILVIAPANSWTVHDSVSISVSDSTSTSASVLLRFSWEQ